MIASVPYQLANFFPHVFQTAEWKGEGQYGPLQELFQLPAAFIHFQSSLFDFYSAKVDVVHRVGPDLQTIFSQGAHVISAKVLEQVRVFLDIVDEGPIGINKAGRDERGS